MKRAQAYCVLSATFVIYAPALFADAPESRPATTRPAATRPADIPISKLLRDLNSPSPQTRQRAAYYLERAPIEALPELKKAAENAPYETRALLEPIIKNLQGSSAGVILVSLQFGGWGSAQSGDNQHPGDIFYRINDTPIRSVDEWDSFWKNAPYGDHTAQIRPISGNPFYHWRVDPYSRWPHYFFMNYQERYGPPLRKALNEAWEQHYQQADQAFEEAVRAGAPILDSNPAGTVRALTRYYTGRPEEAKQLFRDLVAKHAAICTDDPWQCVRLNASKTIEYRPADGWGTFSYGSPAPVADGHFSLMIRQEAMANRPNAHQLTASLAYHLSGRLHRYPEAVAAYAKLIAAALPEEDKSDYLKNARGELFVIFQALKMKQEVLELARLAVDDRNLWPGHFAGIASVAAEAGDEQLAERCRKRYPEVSGEPREKYYTLEYALLNHLNADHLDDARKALRAHSATDAVKNGPYYGSYAWGWRSLAGEWAALARQAIKESPGDEATLSAAFFILARQSEVDLNELQSLAADLDKLTSIRIDGKPKPDSFRQVILALHRSDYAEALRIHQDEWLPGARPAEQFQITPDTVRNRSFPSEQQYSQANRQNANVQHAQSAEYSLKFLAEHGSALAAHDPLWKRTWEAYPVGPAGWVLITRDLHLGLASPDLKRVEELPIPGPIWRPSANDARPWTGRRFVFVSPTGNTIAIRRGSSQTNAINEEGFEIASLHPGDRGWTHLLAPRSNSLPRGIISLENLPDILDPLHDEIVHRGQPLSITAWSVSMPGSGHRWDALVCLVDGSNVHLRGPSLTHPNECRSPLLLDLKDLLTKTTGQPTVVYSQSPATPNPQTATAYFLFTDHGLFRYDLETSALTPLPLPDGTSPPVVALLDGELSPDSIRFGVLPAAGGATYRLHLQTGEIKPEGCINDTLPLLYWANRTEEQNRAAVLEELAKVNQKWPLDLSYATTRVPKIPPKN